MLRVFLAGTAVIFACMSSAHGQVIPDGGTATTTTVSSSGHVTVHIAPKNADKVSYNTYDDFNVPEEGLSFDNFVTSARTIVNEVTGTDLSLIQGDVEVLGQRAHVILANPNGITVDGGRFINTGGVSLSTGDLSFISRLVAPSVTQDNAFIEVNQGVIRIEGAGLTGVMDSLDILAKNIFIDGPLINENTNPAAEINLYGGDYTAEYDVSILPTNNHSSFSNIDKGIGGVLDNSPNALLVDITSKANIAASSVLVEVSDLGAGVRYAGDGLATRRGFTLSADGEVRIEGGDITAAIDLIVDAGEVNANADFSDPLNERLPQLNAAFGGVLLNANTGDIALEDVQIAGAETGFNPLMQGGVTILTPGALQISSTRLDENSLIASTGTTQNSDIFVRTGSDIDLNQTDFGAGSDVDIFTPSDFDWVLGKLSAGEDLRLGTDTDLRLDGVESFTNGKSSILANNISIGDASVRTSLTSNDDMTLEAVSGSIISTGALIQSLNGGSLDVKASDDIEIYTGNDIGILYANGNLNIEAGGDILNDTARFVADGQIDILAGDEFRARIDFPNGQNTAQPSSATTDYGDWWRKLLGSKTRTTTLDYGPTLTASDLAYVSAGGDVNITAQNTYAIGAEFSANGGDLNITSDKVYLEGVFSGTLEYRRSCFLFCNSDGFSSVAIHGGRLSASGDVNIIGASTLEVNAAEILALNNANIDADLITLRGALIPTFNKRPSGLYNFWSGSTSWLIWRELYGTIHAFNTLNITSQNPVQIYGGFLSADIVSNLQGEDVFSAPEFSSPVFDHQLGWFGRAGLFSGKD